MSKASDETVAFIANLIPLYTHLTKGPGLQAMCLRDGTLIMPVSNDDDPYDDPDEWVTVWWQGDESRASDLPANLVASNAVVEFVKFHSVGKDAEYSGNLLSHLAEHYERKTGGSLYLPYLQDDATTLSKAIKNAKRFWPDAVWELLKKGTFG